MPGTKSKSVKNSSSNAKKSVSKKPKVVAKSASKAKAASKAKSVSKPKAASKAKAVSKSAVSKKTSVTKKVTATSITKLVKSVRSFKVRLPGSETYEGRFTGLTPYQAANKALSSYYRSNPKSKVSKITFTIKESTRGSKRNEYTYNGKREKLATPVEYPIKSADGTIRTIRKAFKNRLTKIKKAELAKLLEASA